MSEGRFPYREQMKIRIRLTARTVGIAAFLLLGAAILGILFLPGPKARMGELVRHVLWTRPVLSLFLGPEDVLTVTLDEGRHYRLVAPGWARLAIAPGEGCLPIRLVPVTGTITLTDEGDWHLNQTFQGLTPHELIEQVAADRRTWQFPYVLIALPGALGSDGRIGDGVRHPEILHRALDRLKDRYRRPELCVAAESWAGVALARLIEERTDIACAVFVSTPFSRDRDPHYERLVEAGAYPPYNPMDHWTAIMAHVPEQLVFIGDPEDRVVPFATQQRPFIEKTVKAFTQARFFSASGTPPQHHVIPGIAVGLLKDFCPSSPPPADERSRPASAQAPRPGRTAGR